VPVARALVRAGHEVAFATAGEFCPRVEEAGFVAFPAGLSLPRQLDEAARRFPEEAAMPPGKDRFVSFVPRMLAAVAAPPRVDDLVPVVERWQPDLVVHDEAELAAPIAAEVAGVAWASHSIVLLRPPEMTRLAGQALAPLCERWGVDLGPLGGLYRYLHLDACPSSLQVPDAAGIAVDQPVRNTENLDTAGDERLPTWVAELAPVPTVYVTLGTVFNRNRRAFASILEGVAGLAVNVIATIGYDHSPAALGPVPANVRVERYIPLSLLLAHLDAVVTQGGTSILPALGHGLPLLLLPQGADQFHNAEACLAAGVGRRLLPEELTPDAVRGEVETLLLEPAFRERARHVQREIAEMPSPDEVVPLLERLARERRPLVRRR
jgi:UDP:flavonoid glycosyltransferase YjiC (YdhE family)